MRYRTETLCWILTAALFQVASSYALSAATSNTLALRTSDKTTASVGEEIAITVTVSNLESIPLRGFYFADNLPQELEITTTRLTLGGAPLDAFVFESSTPGEVYAGRTTRRWVVETPPAFAENAPLDGSSDLEIVYSVTASESGVFNLDAFHWVGLFTEGDTGAGDGTPTFGHSETADRLTLTFTQVPVELIQFDISKMERERSRTDQEDYGCEESPRQVAAAGVV